MLMPIRKAAELESNSSNAALDKKKVQGRPCQKFLVRVASIRKRLLDEDNLCEKYHVDLCRYAGILPCDEASQVKIEVCQKKAGKEDVEKTIIEVFEL
jgi:hypothetical protein